MPIEFGPEPAELFLALYGTGIRGSTAAEPVLVTIGGEPAEVVFAGPHPTLAGVDQVNVKVPRKLAGRGAVDVVLSVGAQSANTVTVAIR